MAVKTAQAILLEHWPDLECMDVPGHTVWLDGPTTDCVTYAMICTGLPVRRVGQHIEVGVNHEVTRLERKFRTQTVVLTVVEQVFAGVAFDLDAWPNGALFDAVRALSTRELPAEGPRPVTPQLEIATTLILDRVYGASDPGPLALSWTVASTLRDFGVDRLLDAAAALSHT